MLRQDVTYPTVPTISKLGYNTAIFEEFNRLNRYDDTDTTMLGLINVRCI